jgi:Protein of unknown function DUF262/Protein of unknown function (DUF1524)
MPLEIRHLSLAELLSRSKAFHMARYQRRYEWGRREMEQLLEDLGDVFDAHQSAPSAEPFHFLGNVIVFSHAAGYLEVVDGQQRLTSLTTVIAAARDLTDDADFRTELENYLSVASAEPAAVRNPRLHLHRGDNEFLHRHILADGAAHNLEKIGAQNQPGAECLRANCLMARTWLSRLADADRTAYIRFVLQYSRFVEIQVGSEDDAFRIFETVNNRGRPISSEDVLRYALVEYATDEQSKRDEYLELWDAMEAELGPRGMKRFIAGWRTRATKGSRIKQALHRTLLDSFDSPAEARAFLDSELSNDLATFRQIETADVALADGRLKQRIDALLRSLALVDFDEWLPVASELLKQGASQPERLIRDLQRLERLAWFFYLSRDDKGVYQERRELFSALMKIASDPGTFDALPPRSLLSAEQRAKMRDTVQGRLDPKWVPLRSLLVRLEMALVGDGVTIVRNDLTIEHILPLRPKSKAWLTLYDNNQTVITEFAEQIGNLCLVSAELNTTLGNQIYANKRRLLMLHAIPARSPLAADIGVETNWTRDVISRRSQQMIRVFSETFDISEKAL